MKMRKRVELRYPYNLIERIGFYDSDIWHIPFGTISEEQNKRLEECISELSPMERQVLLLKYREKASLQRIVEETKMKRGGIDAALSKALLKLRKPKKLTYVLVGMPRITTMVETSFEDEVDLEYIKLSREDPIKADILKRLLEYEDISKEQFLVMIDNINTEKQKAGVKVSSYLAYENAKEYLHGSRLLGSKENLLVIPAIMCAVFACELAIKSVLIEMNQNKKTIREHNIRVLYEALPEEAKAYVRDNEIFNDWDEFMTDASTAFTKYRYMHEDIDNSMLNTCLSDYWHLAKWLLKYYQMEYGQKKRIEEAARLY